MISDPSLLRYACVAHQIGGVGGGNSSTILAEYNTSGDSSLQELAQECLIRTPLNHSLFSHTVHNSSYTFLIDDPFVYFAIADDTLPKSDRIWLLNGLKDAAQHLIAKHGKSILSRSKSFNSLCFQSQIYPIVHQLVSDGEVKGEIEAERKGRRKIGVLFGEGLKKKKRLFGEGDSREVLVEDKIELSDQGGEGDGGVGGKVKARKVWRRHVWVVLVLDLVVCLILFGIWLAVCHGLRCID